MKPVAREPTPVRVGMMDRRRPERIETVPLRHLGLGERAWRGLKRGAFVMGVLLVFGNLALFFVPLPAFHLCVFPIAFVAGPIVAAFTWRDRVSLGTMELACPRCAGALRIPDDLGGWPARFNCHHCGIMVELNPA